MLSFMLELCSKCFSFSETKRRSMLDPEIFKVTLWDSMTVVGVTVSVKLLGLRNNCVNLYFTMGYQLQIFNFWFTFKVILKVKYVCVSMTLKVNKIMFWVFKHTYKLEKKFSFFELWFEAKHYEDDQHHKKNQKIEFSHTFYVDLHRTKLSQNEDFRMCKNCDAEQFCAEKLKNL